MNILTKVCKLRNQLIQWPKGQAALNVIADFQELRECSFPDVIGCVDGTHIAISAPKNEKAAYLTKKQFSSVILQAVCDSKLVILDGFAGWPGSSHDGRVWGNSPLYLLISRNAANMHTRTSPYSR